MKFNNWNITVKYKGEHQVLTNDDTLVIIDQDGDVVLYVRENEGILKINKIDYRSDFYIDAEKRVLILDIHNPLYEDE